MTIASRRALLGYTASVGGDTITAIKQAAEFGLGRRGQRLAGFLVFITDVHALGIEVAQGLYVSSGFYWTGTQKPLSKALERQRVTLVNRLQKCASQD